MLGAFQRVKQSLQVDAAMCRGERTEPPRRLLELALATNAVPAAGLIPRDRDVDEALEEVFLRWVCREPDVFERLVGLEVLALGNLLETGL